MQTVVAGYRYTGSYPLYGDPSLGNDIDYVGTSGVVVHKGASVTGWSVSTDNGLTWSAKGKISPPQVPREGFGDPMAFYWGDPSVATGLSLPNEVAYAFLAGSLSTWNTLTGGGNVLNQWPTTTSPDAVDSFCLAYSLDAGNSFGVPICVRPTGIGPMGTDQPNVTFAAGQVYPHVVVDDLDGNRPRLYQGNFELSVDSAMNGFDRSPRLRRDQLGNVWLAATGTPRTDPDHGHIRLCRLSGSTCVVVPNVAGTSGIDVTSDADVPWASIDPGSSVGPLRSGTTLDFAPIYHSSPTGDAWEYIFVYPLPPSPGNVQHIGATDCLQPASGTVMLCVDIPEWGTASMAGNQFQPKLEVIDRSGVVEQFGSQLDKRYAFYEIDGAGVPSGDAAVFRATMQGSAFFGPPPSLTIEAPAFFGLAPSVTPKVCPAHYSSTALYWGDFFAFRFVPATATLPFSTSLGVFSSDEGRGCISGGSNWQGDTLHLVGYWWSDPP